MFLGIDWGGTYIKACLVDARGKIREKFFYSSRDLTSQSSFCENIKFILARVGRRKVQGVGIGAPGIVDPQKGFIYYLPNVPGWERYPLKKKLENILKLPGLVENDANVFALAEFAFGAGKGAKSLIFLTLGTGLGGAVIVDGKLLEGRTSAAELGHVPVSLKGIRCGCGGRGCIETFVGNNYLLKKYRKLKPGTNIEEVADIFKLAMKGEKEALLLWKEFSYALGMFLAGMVNVFNPERVIFGGGVAGAFRIFKPLVQQTIQRQAMWPQAKSVKLLKAKIKFAGIVGAAVLAKQRLMQ